MGTGEGASALGHLWIRLHVGDIAWRTLANDLRVRPFGGGCPQRGVVRAPGEGGCGQFDPITDNAAQRAVVRSQQADSAG
jgi:hypothetical protein